MGQPGLRWLADRTSGADQAESSLTGSMGFASKPAGRYEDGQPQTGGRFWRNALIPSWASGSRALSVITATARS